jgi:Zn-dependent M28 family amino/carboxypeptidase
MSWDPQMRWLDGEDKPVDAHPELKERFRLNQAAFAKLLQSSGHSIDQVFATAELGQPQGFTLPGTLTLTSTTGLRRTESTNVVGVLKGSDPVLRSQYIVVTAHLDHLGRGAAVNGDAIYNGAHDNASGIAILLELARALAHSASPPKRSIIFVAVTGEEKGLVGSDYFAANAASNRVRMVANLNIDMPMIFGPTLDWIVLGAEHSTLGETATHAVQNHGYVTSRDRRPEEVLFIRSDQFSFIRRGIPSVYLGSGYRSRTRSVDVAALQQEFLRTHYHQPSDDLALPMYYAGAADLIQIESELLLETANQDDRPHWNRTSFFGKKFAR